MKKLGDSQGIAYCKGSIKPPGANLSETILQVGAYSKGALLSPQVLGSTGPGIHRSWDPQVLGCTKNNVSFAYCTLRYKY